MRGRSMNIAAARHLRKLLQRAPAAASCSRSRRSQVSCRLASCAVADNRLLSLPRSGCSFAGAVTATAGGSRPRAPTAAARSDHRARYSARTSSTSPARSIASKRALSRRRQLDRAMSAAAHSVASGNCSRAPCVLRCQCEIGTPVSRYTSSARWMRCASLRAMRRRRSRIDPLQLGMQRGPAGAGRRASISRRTRRRGRRHLAPDHGAAPAGTAWCRRPAAAVRHAAGSPRWQRAPRARTRRPSSSAPGRGCRSDDAARAHALRTSGLALPMSMPRYTCTESTLTISTGSCGCSALDQLPAPARSCRCRSGR